MPWKLQVSAFGVVPLCYLKKSKVTVNFFSPGNYLSVNPPVGSLSVQQSFTITASFKPLKCTSELQKKKTKLILRVPWGFVSCFAPRISFFPSLSSHLVRTCLLVPLSSFLSFLLKHHLSLILPLFFRILSLFHNLSLSGFLSLRVDSVLNFQTNPLMQD